MDIKADTKLPEPDCSSSTPDVPKIQRNKFPKPNKFGPRQRDVRDETYITEKLSHLTGPTIDLPPVSKTEDKFSGRCRLYVGNLPPKISQDDVINLFQKYGEVSDTFYNPSKNFGFLRMDYYANAERAKAEINGQVFKGRVLTVRFAHPASIFVKNLSPYVSNELLHLGFSSFGDIERAVVIVDERGKSTGRGIIQFVKKASAITAINYCKDRCFFLTSSLKPVIVENYEPTNDVDGLPEGLIRKCPEYYQAREAPPRFARHGSFEEDYAKHWRELHAKYKEKMAALKSEFFYEEQKLEADMLKAQYDHETERLKELLRVREMERDRIKQEWELRCRQLDNRQMQQPKMMTVEEERGRLRHQDSLYIQASQLTSLLDSEEEKLQAQWGSASYTQEPPFVNMSSARDEIWCTHKTMNMETYNRPKRSRH